MKQKHIESMNISQDTSAHIASMGIRIFIRTILLERKWDYFLRNNVGTELLNSILLCLQFPKHWRNIHIYSIRSTHNTSMVAPSLKLNTTRVTRVIDEHLEFPHLHIWYEGPSLFMKTRNNLWVSQMLGRKEINLLCSRQIDSVLLLCRWNAPHIQRTSIYYFSCVYIHDCASLLKLCKKSPYFLRTISFIKQSIIRIQFQVFNNTGM